MSLLAFVKGDLNVFVNNLACRGNRIKSACCKEFSRTMGTSKPAICLQFTYEDAIARDPPRADTLHPTTIGRLVHLHFACADTATIEVELNIGVQCQQGHGHSSVGDSL